ncbi:DUF3515 domain-containing protein [Pseudonocardia sp. CA-107938]|uniref:DUF3515 domain-containing protein n=1 Tax=Pseudonocardia sp. CA-107938 TaxID=3240021 RepID=UPI003D937973
MSPRSGGRTGVWSPPVLLAVAIPALFAVAVAVLAVIARTGGLDARPVAETGPFAVAPVEAPAATDPACATLLDALPGTLAGSLPAREITPPTPGVRAWAAAPRPVVLRCGLPRPAELGPTSPLLQVNGVAWLTLDDGVPDPVVLTHVAVDRQVFIAVTLPVATGTGPLQEISDVVAQKLEVRPVPVR